MSLGGVLVTGATTPIGERLCRSLLADSNVQHVLAVGHHPPERAMPFAHGDRLVYQQVDLSKSRAVHELLFGVARDLGVQVVMHLAMHRSLSARGSKVHAHNVDSLRSFCPCPSAIRPFNDWCSSRKQRCIKSNTIFLF